MGTHGNAIADSLPSRAETVTARLITACAETEANARSAVITAAVAIARLGVAVTGFDFGFFLCFRRPTSGNSGHSFKRCSSKGALNAG